MSASLADVIIFLAMDGMAKMMPDSKGCNILTSVESQNIFLFIRKRHNLAGL